MASEKITALVEQVKELTVVELAVHYRGLYLEEFSNVGV